MSRESVERVRDAFRRFQSGDSGRTEAIDRVGQGRFELVRGEHRELTVRTLASPARALCRAWCGCRNVTPSGVTHPTVTGEWA
jgi:hypothetical protein